MAGGYDSDSSYEETSTKQTKLQKKDYKNNGNGDHDISTHVKQVKEKNTTEGRGLVIPEILCECQQKCTEKVGPALIQRVCMYFNGIQSKERQLDYLASLILIKERQLQAGEEKDKEKTLRKMSFRYFVPQLSVEDMRKQREEAGGVGFPPWDHIEVCLRAYTAIHIISEKRVSVTRANRRLQIDMKCSLPFMGLIPSGGGKRKAEEDREVESKKLQESGTDVRRAAAEWLAASSRYEHKRGPVMLGGLALDPDTLLPEGLVFPASVTCLPLITPPLVPSPATKSNLRELDLDLVARFFTDQLWNIEHIGVP